MEISIAQCYYVAMLYNDRKPAHELDDTAASAADDRLEEILRKIKAAGGKITSDELIPLHMDFNNEVVEVGERRLVEFVVSAMKMEFQITRDVKYKRMGGAGPHKHLEDIARPMIETKLKKRPESSEQWEAVDIDDIF